MNVIMNESYNHQSLPLPSFSSSCSLSTFPLSSCEYLQRLISNHPYSYYNALLFTSPSSLSSSPVCFYIIPHTIPFIIQNETKQSERMEFSIDKSYSNISSLSLPFTIIPSSTTTTTTATTTSTTTSTSTISTIPIATTTTRSKNNPTSSSPINDNQQSSMTTLPSLSQMLEQVKQSKIKESPIASSNHPIPSTFKQNECCFSSSMISPATTNSPTLILSPHNRSASSSFSSISSSNSSPRCIRCLRPCDDDPILSSSFLYSSDNQEHTCERKNCMRKCKLNSKYCKWHVESRICKAEGCEKNAKAGGSCISHGGGRRCQHPSGCTKSAKKGDLCIAHGGGIRCSFPSCKKGAVSNRLCVAHGGIRKPYKSSKSLRCSKKKY